VAAAILDGEGYPPGRVSIAFVDDGEMTRVNREFRGKGKTTDVLSFDLRETVSNGRPPGPRDADDVLGEILVSVPRASVQAREAGAALGEEVARLVIHGLLHLAGYDHMKPAERRVMRAREAHWFAATAAGRGWIKHRPAGRRRKARA
jgi:probable rRNA maturation factor